MAKYLIEVSYTLAGTQGLLKQGGSARRAVVEKALGALGGKLEAFYYTVGEKDAILICDVPDAVGAAALSLTVNAAGGAKISTTPLLSVEDVDAACKKSVNYTAPGA